MKKAVYISAVNLFPSSNRFSQNCAVYACNKPQPAIDSAVISSVMETLKSSSDGNTVQTRRNQMVGPLFKRWNGIMF